MYYEMFRLIRKEQYDWNKIIDKIAKNKIIDKIAQNKMFSTR